MKIEANRKRNGLANRIERIMKQLQINPFTREIEREELLESDILKPRLAVQAIYVRNTRK